MREKRLFLLSGKQISGFACQVLIGFLLVCLPYVSLAQRSAEEGLRSRIMERLDDAEASKFVKFFRAQRLEENFCFQFQLKHKPRRGRTVRYDGIVYGSWNEQGPVSRFKLFPEEVSETSPVGLSPIEMIVQNGPLPKVWIRRQGSKEFTLIEDGALFEPVFDGILYTPFDLQMPFIFWNKYAYEGPSRVLSRIGQKFLMYPPENSLAERNGVTAVRVSIDDAYFALLRAEVLQSANAVRSRFTVRGIKKVQDQYIVKEVELKNLVTKDATTFKVSAASLGLEWDDSIFDPNQPAELPEISSKSFEVL